MRSSHLKVTITYFIQGVFLTRPPLKMSRDCPPRPKKKKLPRLASSLNFLSVEIPFTWPDTWTIYIIGGGPVWDSNVFFEIGCLLANT